jgi:Fe-Mn family superoxide dismutase
MFTNRRNFLKSSLMASLTALIYKAPAQIATYSLQLGFSLPPLNFSYDALEPFVDARTMEIHYTKHHQAYVNKLNEAIKLEPSIQDWKLEKMFAELNSLPEKVRTIIRNNGGGHWNHSLFWSILKKGTTPQGKVALAIEKQFQTIEQFQVQFNKQAMSVFGSGWVWLILKDKELMITTTANQDNPLMQHVAFQGEVIFGLDVWEHAYYLKHQNKRADYLEAFWSVLNWEEANKRYMIAIKKK